MVSLQSLWMNSQLCWSRHWDEYMCMICCVVSASSILLFLLLHVSTIVVIQLIIGDIFIFFIWPITSASSSSCFLIIFTTQLSWGCEDSCNALLMLIKYCAWMCRDASASSNLCECAVGWLSINTTKRKRYDQRERYIESEIHWWDHRVISLGVNFLF